MASKPLMATDRTRRPRSAALGSKAEVAQVRADIDTDHARLDQPQKRPRDPKFPEAVEQKMGRDVVVARIHQHLVATQHPAERSPVAKIGIGAEPPDLRLDRSWGRGLKATQSRARRPATTQARTYLINDTHHVETVHPEPASASQPERQGPLWRRGAPVGFHRIGRRLYGWASEPRIPLQVDRLRAVRRIRPKRKGPAPNVAERCRA
jgi:hypothetical protein